MMSSKKYKKNGFALSEVLFALTVIATAIMAIMSLAGTLIKQSERSRTLIEKYMRMSNFLTQAHQKQFMNSAKPITHVDEEQHIKLTYESKSIPEKSTLKGIKNLKLEKVTEESGGAAVKEVLISFYAVKDKT